MSKWKRHYFSQCTFWKSQTFLGLQTKQFPCSSRDTCFSRPTSRSAYLSVLGCVRCRNSSGFCTEIPWNDYCTCRVSANSSNDLWIHFLDNWLTTSTSSKLNSEPKKSPWDIVRFKLIKFVTSTLAMLSVRNANSKCYFHNKNRLRHVKKNESVETWPWVKSIAKTTNCLRDKQWCRGGS